MSYLGLSKEIGQVILVGLKGEVGNVNSERRLGRKLDRSAGSETLRAGGGEAVATLETTAVTAAATVEITLTVYRGVSAIFFLIR